MVQLPCRETYGVSTLLVCISLLIAGFSSPLSAQNPGSWYTQSTSGVTPEKRHESAFVQVGDLFYLIGGRGNKRVQVYNPTTKVWSTTQTVVNDIHHFQARAYNGRIYLLGALTGGYPNENPLANVMIYDPQQDKLLTGATIPVARRRGSSGIVLYNGAFYQIAGNRNGHSAFLDNSSTSANVAWVDKYDPATGNWTVLPDAPRARDHFFAEVIGDKVYVAGGRRSRAGTAAGTWSDTEVVVDVFDLSSETWVAGNLLPDQLPTARAGAATAVLNNELLVIGGEVNDNPPGNLALAHTEVLNTSTGRWRRVADLGLQRHATQAIVFQDDIYVAGGSKTKGGTEITANEAFLEAFSFDGAPGATYANWTNIGNSPAAKSEAPAVVYGGEYYVFNGFLQNIKISNALEKYNPATNTWTSLKPMPTVNGKITAVTHNGTALVGDVVWIAGGRVGDNPGAVTDAVWLYDISEDSWTKGPSLPLRRGGGGLARLGNALHYVGGFDANASCDVDIHLKYDLGNPGAGWQDLTSSSPMPMARNHFGTVTLGGKLYAVGGQHGHDGCGGGVDVTTVHAYDPVTDRWARLADLPQVQSHTEPSTFVHNGKIVVVGGSSSGGRGIWEYDPATNNWKVLTDLQLPASLLAPVARVYRGNLFVLNGGQPSTSTPTSVNRVKAFTPVVNPSLAFHPGTLSRSLKSGERAAVSVILSNLNGEEGAPFELGADDFPAWLSVDRATGYARESATGLTLLLDAAGLSNGTYSYTLSATSPGYQAAALPLTLTVSGGSPPPGTSASQYLEAECARVGSNWQTISDAAASEGKYVSVKNGQPAAGNSPPADLAANRVSFTLNLPQAGLYHLFARIKAPSGQSDSYWVQINGGQWLKWWEGLQTGPAFAWREVLQSPYSLPAGTVTIDVAYREAGALLDKLFLTTTSEVPTALGSAALNCGSTPPPPPPTPTETVVRINAGGPQAILNGQTFAADNSFSGGKSFGNPSATVSSVYQTERSSDAPYQYTYRVSVPNGDYRIRLHFAEIYFGATGGGPGGAGQRVFDVRLEDQLILNNYDINADVGPQTVVIKEFPITITDGSVDLFFDASAAVGGINQPKLSALEVISTGGTPPAPEPGPVASLWAEAECTETGSAWARQTSSSASGGSYVVYPGNKNLPMPTAFGGSEQLQYTVDLTEAATYTLYVRMNTPTVSKNSFWVSVDDGGWINFWQDTGNAQLLTKGFEWKEVLDNGLRVPLQLSAGTHRIRIAPRETGTELDKVYLGTGNSAPTGMGQTATNCTPPGIAARSTMPFAAARTAAPVALDKLDLFPNPVGSLLQFVLNRASPGTVDVQVLDMTGRVLRQQQPISASTEERLTGSIDVEDLPAGSYRLRVVDSSAGTVISRPFIKLR